MRLKSRSGQRIRLETQFVRGTICVSRDDVGRFSDAPHDADWQPPVYRNTREEGRMRREAEGGINTCNGASAYFLHHLQVAFAIFLSIDFSRTGVLVTKRELRVFDPVFLAQRRGGIVSQLVGRPDWHLRPFACSPY